MERSKAGTKEKSPDGLLIRNQITIVIKIFYYFTRYGKSRMKLNIQTTKWT